MTATAPINANAITRTVITLDVVVRPSFDEATMLFNDNKVLHIRIFMIASLLRDFSGIREIIVTIFPIISKTEPNIAKEKEQGKRHLGKQFKNAYC